MNQGRRAGCGVLVRMGGLDRVRDLACHEALSKLLQAGDDDISREQNEQTYSTLASRVEGC